MRKLQTYHITFCPGKVFAHVLLARLEPLLTETRRTQQSGFTSGRSIADAILALRLLSDLHREFSQPLYAVYFDLKSGFDSVDRETLWNALRGIGAPMMLLNLIKDLYTQTNSQVRIGKHLFPSFQNTSGIWQGHPGLQSLLYRLAVKRENHKTISHFKLMSFTKT